MCSTSPLHTTLGSAPETSGLDTLDAAHTTHACSLPHQLAHKLAHDACTRCRGQEAWRHTCTVRAQVYFLCSSTHQRIGPCVATLSSRASVPFKPLPVSFAVYLITKLADDVFFRSADVRRRECTRPMNQPDAVCESWPTNTILPMKLCSSSCLPRSRAAGTRSQSRSPPAPWRCQ